MKRVKPVDPSSITPRAFEEGLLFYVNACQDNIFPDGPKRLLELQLKRSVSKCREFATCAASKTRSTELIRDNGFCVLEASVAILQARERTGLSLDELLARFLGGLPARVAMKVTHDRLRFTWVTDRAEIRQRLEAMVRVIVGDLPPHAVTAHQLVVSIPDGPVIEIRQKQAVRTAR